MSIPRGHLQRIGQIPELVVTYRVGMKHAKSHGQSRRSGWAVLRRIGNLDVGQINHLAWCVAEPPQPLEEAGILHRGSARQPRDLSIAGETSLVPQSFRPGADFIPAGPTEFFLNPFRAHGRISRIDRPETQIVEAGDDLVVSASLP